MKKKNNQMLTHPSNPTNTMNFAVCIHVLCNMHHQTYKNDANIIQKLLPLALNS